MVISPLNHMFWRSVAGAILIDRHNVILWRTFGIYAKSSFNSGLYIIKISWIRRRSRNEGVCIRQRSGLLVKG